MVSVDQILSVTKSFFPVIGAYLLGVLTTFGHGFVNEFFGERARKSAHKREVARHVLQMCTEASTYSYNHLPRDIEKLNSTLTNLEGFDKKTCKIMESFASSWQIIAKKCSKKVMTAEDARFAKEQRDIAEELRKILVTWANKTRIG